MALNFNGTTQFAAVHTSSTFDILHGATAASFSIWLNRDTAGVNQALMHKSNDADTNWCFELTANSSDDFVWITSNGGSTAIGTVTTTLSASTWYYLTVVYNGAGAADADKIKMYIDGTAQSVTFSGAAQPSSLPTIAGSHAFYMGQRGSSTLFLDGTLENGKIWTVALDPSEVAIDRYSWSPVRPEYCVMWAPMTDLGADNAFTESSTQGWTNHAAVAGTSLVTGPGIFSYGAAARMPRSGSGERRHQDSRRNKFRRTGMTTGYPRWGLR